ncbi:MAG TPA: MFS transporter [Burkholderiales bacterium]|jgi:D-galactonate transporter|nr:MFS transporter [Burkholderiales bacterium]
MSQIARAAPLPQPVAAEKLAYQKVTLRLVPFLFLCYLAAYLDRVNVGFAKLQMQDDLGFSSTVYGLGAGIFFVGYVLFEVPSNMILHKVGAKLWIARIMITWGLISGAMMFVETPTQFYLLRFLLGVAEAGFIPGVLLYLTYWYPAARRGRIVALFLAGIPVSSIFGGPVSGWILNTFADVGGLRGWQWLFVIEAMPSVILGILTLFLLDDGVRDVKWLTEAEKRIISDRIAEENQEKGGHAGFGDAFKSGRVWLLSVAYFFFASAIYVTSFWLPTLIKARGVNDPLHIGLLVAIPYTVATIAMIWTNVHADRTRERRWHAALPCFLAGVGLLLSALPGQALVYGMLALTLATAGACAAVAAFWSLPAAFLVGAAAATGIALINSLGNVAGFVSTSLVGWISDLTGSAQASLYLFGALMFVGGAMVLAIPAKLVNK